MHAVFCRSIAADAADSCLFAQWFSLSNVYLKLESELPTGSFKVRGALYALGLQMQRRDVSEVVASSTGNHGAAVAYAAQLLGLERGCSAGENNPVKRANIARLGADIVEKGSADLAAAFEAAAAYARTHGAYFLNDANGPRSSCGDRNDCVRDSGATAGNGCDLRPDGGHGVSSRSCCQQRISFRPK